MLVRRNPPLPHQARSPDHDQACNTENKDPRIIATLSARPMRIEAAQPAPLALPC